MKEKRKKKKYHEWIIPFWRTENSQVGGDEIWLNTRKKTGRENLPDTILCSGRKQKMQLAKLDDSPMLRNQVALIILMFGVLGWRPCWFIDMYSCGVETDWVLGGECWVIEGKNNEVLQRLPKVRVCLHFYLFHLFLNSSPPFFFSFLLNFLDIYIYFYGFVVILMIIRERGFSIRLSVLWWMGRKFEQWTMGFWISRIVGEIIQGIT